MKKLFVVSLCLGSLLASISPAADLKQSKFTQVVNDVRVISTADNLEKPAVVNAVFNMPDLVRTGEASRAELVADDKTITRVGANTIFAFDPANRTIDLQQGSLLFHSPKGKGGGTIRTGSATASVLGTTLIVTTTRDNGFKVIDLEGHVAITFSNGTREQLSPGQMTFVLPGGNPSPVITIRLDNLTSNSLLVHGFEQPLPSWALIRQELAKQAKLIESGQAEDTGLLVGDWADRTTVQVVKLDLNTILGQQKSDEPPPPTDNTPPPPAPGTINSSLLPTAYIVSSPFTVGSFTFPFGFSAPNITINTPTIDLSPYSTVPEFAFVAPNGTLTINGSVAFNGLLSTAILDLYANQFSFASGSTVQANVGTFNLYPQTATTLSGVSIVDNASAASAPVGITAALSTSTSSSSLISLLLGGIDFTSPTAFSLTNGSSITAQNLPVHLVASAITLNKSSVQGSFVGLKSTLVTPVGTTGISLANGSSLKATSGNLDLLAVGSGINVSASTLKAVQGASFNGSNTGQILIAATGGTVNLTNGTTISAADALTINSDTGVSISGSSVQGGPLVDLFGATGVSIASNSTLTATGGDMDIFTGTGDVNLSASTINAIASTPSTSSSDGTIFIYGVGGMANLTNGTALSAAGTLLVAGDTGVTISDSSLTAGNENIIGSNGPISVTGSATTTGYTTTFTGNTIISSGTSLNVNGAAFNADPNSGTVALSDNSGSTTLQNASVTAGTLTLASEGASSLVTVQNASIAASTLTVNTGLISGSGSINVQNSSIATGNPLALTAGATSGSITVQNSAINAPSVTMTALSTATSDMITVNQNTSITTTNLTLNSGDGILLDGTGGLNGGGSGTVSLMAPYNFNDPNASTTVSNADFSSFAQVNIAGYTLYLTNVIFSGTSTVYLYSRNGSATFVPTFTPAIQGNGNVNFIGNNNKYGVIPINAGTLNQSTLPNIHLNSST